MQNSEHELIDIALDAYRKGIDCKMEVWHQQLMDAANLIEEAKGRIIFSGLGKSGWVAGKLAATFNGLGLPAAQIHPSDALHGDIGMARKEDIFVLISKSASSQELILLANWLQNHQLVVIGLLGNLSGPLAKYCHATLDCSVPREADPDNLAPTASTTITLIGGEILALLLKYRKGFNSKDFARLHPAGQLGRNLHQQVENVMHKPENIARVSPNDSFRNVLVRMTQFNLGAACVIENNILVGIITEGDIRRALIQNISIDQHTAKDIMNPEFIYISPNSSLMNALETMESEIKCSVLPVVNPQMECIGLIRLHDIYGK
jgi:arabinose-5-phosphate isomerase